MSRRDLVVSVAGFATGVAITVWLVHRLMRWGGAR